MNYKNFFYTKKEICDFGINLTLMLYRTIYCFSYCIKLAKDKKKTIYYL